MPSSPHLAATPPSLAWMTAAASPPPHPTPASAQPQAPLQPLLPSQTEASNWTKVRSGPLPGTLLRLPPKSSQGPTGPCLTWTPVPSEASLGALPCPSVQAQRPQVLPSLGRMLHLQAPALAGPVRGTLLSQIPKCLCPSPPSGLCTNVTSSRPPYQSSTSQATAGTR